MASCTYFIPCCVWVQYVHSAGCTAPACRASLPGRPDRPKTAARWHIIMMCHMGCDTTPPQPPGCRISHAAGTLHTRPASPLSARSRGIGIGRSPQPAALRCRPVLGFADREVVCRCVKECALAAWVMRTPMTYGDGRFLVIEAAVSARRRRLPQIELP